MRRTLHILWAACQACLGLAVIALAALSPGSSTARGAVEAEARARSAAGARVSVRSEARLPHPGPSLP